MAKTVHIKYYADRDASQLLIDYDTKEPGTKENIKSWEDWMADNAVEHPGAPATYNVYDVVAE